jgi:dTDP-4-amino-4,6-dideoxygalactose transaminase
MTANKIEWDSRLAIDGGDPVMRSWPPRPARWGEEELVNLSEMVGQESLFYWNGVQTEQLVNNFREHYGFKYVMPCSSGTAAIHIAAAAAGIGPGDEVITSPLTDMGTFVGVLYQQAVPVFADIELGSYNIDPAAIERCVSDRTRAIIAVHLAGNPCAMEEINAIAERHGLVVIEDCAQAWGAHYRGEPVGKPGDVACYSLNDFKHLSCGDGGIVAADDDAIGGLLQMYGDKGYERGVKRINPRFLAPNYRISEPQAAIAAAQMRNLPKIAATWNRLGSYLDGQLERIPGIRAREVRPEDTSTYWFNLFCLEPGAFSCSRGEFVRALCGEGVGASEGYISEPAYRWPVFQEHAFFGGGWPLKDAGMTNMDYRLVSCPNSEAILKSGVRVILHDGFTESHVEQIATAVRKVTQHYAAD